MLMAKQRFICEKCGKVFYEYVPDCITPEVAVLILHPKCRKCRIIDSKWKNIQKRK